MPSNFNLELAEASLDLLGLDPLPPEENLSQLLRFTLGLQDSALIPLEQIAEVISVNLAEILPIPEMPSCVLGICNWRGEMLWLVDLNTLFGYPARGTTETPITIVVRVNTQSVGFVVQQVNDIESHDLQQMQTAVPGLFPSQLLPFALGILPEYGGTVLDLTAIAQCPLWQIHQG